MPTDNRSYIDQALNDLLVRGLTPFMERQLQSRADLEAAVRACVRSQAGRRDVILDAYALLQVMNQVAYWDDKFRDYFQPRSRLVRSYINELIEVRNRHAHPSQEEILSDDDTERALDSIVRLLTAINAQEAEDAKRLKQEFVQARGENIGTAIVPVDAASPPALPASIMPANPIPTIDSRGSIITVAQDGTGQYTTISAAIQAAQPGARIEVQPGHYAEGLIIDRAVEIVGIGGRGGVVVESKHVSCIVMDTDGGAIVRGMTFRYLLREEELELGRASESEWERFQDMTRMDERDMQRLNAWFDAHELPIIPVDRGHLVVEDCDITGFIEGIYLNGASNITIRQSNMEAMTIRIASESQALIEGCDICELIGGGISNRGSLTMRRCNVHGSTIGGEGIRLESGRARIEDCEVRDIHGESAYGGPEPGITVVSCNTTIRNCQIHHIAGPGITIIGVEPDEDDTDLRRGPWCDVEHCEIYETTGPALEIIGQTRAEIKRCTMRDSQETAVYIAHDGRATLEKCHIKANARSGIEIASNSAPTIRNCVIEDGQQCGLIVHHNAENPATVEGCDIKQNGYAGIEIGEDGNLIARQCHINRNEMTAVRAHDGARGVISGCDVTANANGPWDIDPDCKVSHERNIGGDD